MSLTGESQPGNSNWTIRRHNAASSLGFDGPAAHRQGTQFQGKQGEDKEKNLSFLGVSHSPALFKH